MVKFLEGEKICLRPLIESDFEDTFRWLNDREVTKYMRWNLIPQTLKKIREFADNFKGIFLAIVDEKNDKHIGNITLDIDWVSKKAELGILIGEKQGCGYGSEAIKLLMNFAFNDLKLHKLYCGSCNPAYNRIMEKLGWAREGTQKDHYFTEGEYKDINLWGLINE